MTTINVPADLIPLLTSMGAEVGLRAPIITGVPSSASMDLTWTPDLSAAEQATVDRLRALLRSAVRVTPTEWQALEPDIDGLRTYHALATPTTAQTALATKAIIRILRALLRD